MSLSSFRVHQEATGQQSSVLDGKKVTNTHRRASAVGCRCHRSACTKTRTDSRVVPRWKKGDEHPPRVATVGCRCHRSACTKMLPDSRVVPRRKKGDEHPPPRGRGRMSLSSFRVHQDATDSRVVPRQKKGDEHPPPRVHGRMSLSSFRVQQDATGHQSSASTEKVTNTYRRAASVGCRCHRSACTKTQPDSRVGPRRKKVTNTHRRAARGRMSLSSFPRAPRRDRTAG
ncbi:hypothetical protein TNCV_3307721 [Trichonephila clavipes]|nr:hypothetical protein TNCV_3307721 [Trichonephila clavipes]